MFKQQNAPSNFKEVETVIGPSVKVKGNFNGKGNIIVEGIIEGGLKTEGNVFVANKAKVRANVEAREARIGGEVNGNIKTKGYLEVAASAKITGDIECSKLSIEAGATLNGKCTMMSEGSQKENGKEDSSK